MIFQLFVRFLLKSIKENAIIKFIFILPLIKLNNSTTKLGKIWKLWFRVVPVLAMTCPKFGDFVNACSVFKKVHLKPYYHKIYIYTYKQ